MFDNKPDVSIVLPCLNEAATLAACIARAHAALAMLRSRLGLEGEVVVADNGSTDESRAIALRGGARLVEVAERGYGSALLAGFEGARGRYLVMGDADCSYDFVEAVPMVEDLVGGADLCMGSRFQGRILPGAMPWKNRWIGNPALSGILRLLFRTRVSDAHCGLRALTRDCLERLRPSATGMVFASEMVVKAALLGVNLTERPVTLSPDRRGRPPHLRPWRDGWRHLRYMLMLSPGWLFFAPAAAFAALGLAVFVTLLAHQGEVMAPLGPLLVGDHWMIAAAAMLIVGFQTAFFGLAALVHAIREGYRMPSPGMSRVLAAARLEVWLVGGMLLCLGGGAGVAGVVSSWAAEGFGPLSAVRELVGAFTAMIIGVQAFFGGFLLSVLAGNQARFMARGGVGTAKSQAKLSTFTHAH
ncbi:glycosyltransferase family 2 protein [Neoroseomonas soli]|uniref:Glycosyltransferase family 2 protein n=1 Tax=Neoroseomonas soli TaxID=1081025 RepID=A0A9X9X4L6_9PROT|nr:glycosyltransferase family 2 protein [Neoroseomonas soli]